MSFLCPNTNCPRGPQTGSCPTSEPNLRGDPAGSGNDQKGDPISGGFGVVISSSDPSRETSATVAFSMGILIGATSPPLLETCTGKSFAPELSVRYSRFPSDTIEFF